MNLSAFTVHLHHHHSSLFHGILLIIGYMKIALIQIKGEFTLLGVTDAAQSQNSKSYTFTFYNCS